MKPAAGQVPSDVCGVYVSKLEEVAVAAGAQYFLVIDGYGEEFGEYLLDIAEFVPCSVDTSPADICGDSGVEGEGPMYDGYADDFNGGCNSPEFGNPFGYIGCGLFAGTSGWYVAEGSSTRDTDWYETYIPLGGTLDVIGDAEYATYLFELGPQDCGEVAVIQSVVIGPCDEDVLSVSGDFGQPVWLWVGPTVFDGPVYEYIYLLHSNLPIPLATERRSWTDVKALFH